jgi:hypothetical protein
MIKLRVKCENEFEWGITQKLLFKLGYKWNGSNCSILSYDVVDDSISLWDDKTMTISNNSDKRISFSEFINKLENNEIRM